MQALSQSQLCEKLGGVWHGHYFSCKCPFHDDTQPSLLVYKDGGWCMGCRKHYTLQKLSGHAYHVPIDVVAQYGPRLNWKVLGTNLTDLCRFRGHSKDTLQNSVHLLKELEDRGLSRHIINYDDLGYWDGWYVFPVCSLEYSQLTGFVLRASKAIQAKTGHRYATPPQQKDMLFFPHIVSGYKVYVTFGIFDAYAMALAGYQCVTGTRGQNLKAKLLKDSGIREFVLVPDKGEEAAAYNLQAQLGLSAKVLILPYPEGCKDPNDVLVKHGHAVLSNLILSSEFELDGLRLLREYSNNN